jgi:hypothetical protein
MATSQTCCHLPGELLNSDAECADWNDWNDKWQRVIDYRQTKIFFPAPDKSQTKNLLRQTRKDLGLLVRHITGISKLNYPQSLQQPGLSPICRLCGEAREESNHIIRECPALTRTRLETLFQITITDEWFVLGLLHFLTSPVVARLENDNLTNTVPSPPPPNIFISLGACSTR